MKLENITQDTILENYSLSRCDKLVSKSIVYYAYNAPSYGETDIDKCRLYVNKMKLVIKTLNQDYVTTQHFSNQGSESLVCTEMV